MHITYSCEVQYEEHMGSDLVVVNAARQSFNKQKTSEHYNLNEKGINTGCDTGLINFLATGMRTKEWESTLDYTIELSNAISDEYNPAQKAKLRRMLKEHLLRIKRAAVHWAPFGHPQIRLRVRMPIFLARQFAKHQVGGVWSEESRRYITDDITYYMPECLHARPGDIKQGAGQEVHELNDYYLQRMQAVIEASDQLYRDMTRDGVAPEEARMPVAVNAMTGCTWTGSLLFWARLVTQRVDPHAQGAAQVLGQQISDIIQPLFPDSWAALTGINGN